MTKGGYGQEQYTLLGIPVWAARAAQAAPGAFVLCRARSCVRWTTVSSVLFSSYYLATLMKLPFPLSKWKPEGLHS